QGHAELAHCSTGDLIFTPLRFGQPHPDKGNVELGDHAVAQCPVVPHLEHHSAEIRIEDLCIGVVRPLVGSSQSKAIAEICLLSFRVRFCSIAMILVGYDQDLGVLTEHGTSCCEVEVTPAST